MIDETLLADPTRCPDCAGALTAARDVCPRCALPLTGPVAGRLWQVSVQAAEVLRTRTELLAELRRLPAVTPAPPAAPRPPRARRHPPRRSRPGGHAPSGRPAGSRTCCWRSASGCSVSRR